MILKPFTASHELIYLGTYSLMVDNDALTTTLIFSIDIMLTHLKEFNFNPAIKSVKAVNKKNPSRQNIKKDKWVTCPPLDVTTLTR